MWVIAGARVVPIKLDETDEYYTKLFYSINGVLIPGGAQYLNGTPYSETCRKIYNLAVEANDRGDYFPIWGTCLGFEMLQILMAKTPEILTNCSMEDVALPLQFTNKATDSRMFQTLTPELRKSMSTESAAVHYHQRCATYEFYVEKDLLKIMKPLNVNNDTSNVTFVSTFEAVRYPFYGTQWHPEKNTFIWLKRPGHENIPHFNNAISTSQFMANFFVNEARRNSHTFRTRTEETESLIYNYSPFYVGDKGISYEQVYIISNWPDVKEINRWNETAENWNRMF
ncbi:GGH (predicted) [Pycnogonum litorale]